MRTNLTIFLLFFGIALLDAIRGGHWLRVAFWLAVGGVFYLADRRQLANRAQVGGFRLSLVLSALLLAGSGCGPSDATPAVSTADTVAAGSTSADALLLAATRIALPPPGITPGDLAEPASPGAQLVARYCAQCHELPSPLMHSATDWPRVVRRMWLRMDRLPGEFGIRTANEGERGTVLTYLMANGLRVSGGDLPAGRGREDFAAICSRCHALPDIKIHASGDWPAVFMRMERNMERMSVSPPSREQTDNILFYLQEVARTR